ncbi:unnamed protein product [Candidula unifasciata]|uniref:Methyltransferase domain-containing protein n=1 Tax=Candidula unifasciata TaxID=100452 RepID=A0A8S3YLZ7_9EUPU|nr:unnamed protein product [Candidula unifasciata]
MIRHKDKIIALISICTLIVCAVTMVKLSSFTLLAQDSKTSYREGLNRHVLDTWSTDGAMEQLARYNKHLNNNKQPITVDPGNFSTVTEWWQAAAMFAWYIRSPLRYQCKQNLTRFGGWGLCQDEPYTVKAPCLVYSFGIAYDFSFDDAIGKLGCDVRSFDPSMLKVTDHRRSQNVHFYRYGLSDQNTNAFIPDFDEYVKQNQSWKVRTLKHLVGELGHQGKTIDVLKIDIETTEWQVLDNLMETEMLQYVRHLLIEYHFFPKRPPKSNFVHYFQVLTKLRQMGFREYYNKPHSEFLIPDAYRHQGETYYVNANFRPSNKGAE